MNGAELGQKRLKQLYQFLEAFNQQRNPVVTQIDEQHWSLWLEQLPKHNSIRYSSSEDENENYVLKISRPELTKSPQPPGQIRDWLKPGWDDCFKEVERIDTETKVGRDGSEVIEQFTDNPSRVKLFEEWLTRRNEWAKSEKPAREAFKIFEKAYSLYNQIERESGRLELVLGDGILSWRLPSGGIYHPILLQRLQLTFNPQVPEFRFQETAQPVELYTALLRANPEVDPKGIAKIRDEIEAAEYHPMDGDNTTVFFKGLVQRLSPKGVFISTGPLKGEEDYPRLARNPVIFLRSGNLGYARAIEAILEEIPELDSSEIPQSLLNITGIAEDRLFDEPGHEIRLDGGGNEDPDILFNKPANPEQLLIARRLEKHGCVLVQGPPGTGKTHTIANLIGHLLAKGQSVLVTSHTTKALRVLREKVDSRIQSLCVSVLDSDADSQRQMSASIEQIAERLNDDANSLESRAAILRDRRMAVISELENLRTALRNAREGEYRDIVFGGQSFAPSDAARFVNLGEGEHDWIPIPVNEYDSLPLNKSEIADLYTTNVSLTSDDEKDLRNYLPPLDQLMPSQEFDSLIRELRDLSSLDLDDRPELWAQEANSSGTRLLELLRHLELAVDPILKDGQEKLILTLINDGRRGPEHRKPWEELIEKIEQLAEFAALTRSRIVEFGPKLSLEIPLSEQVKTLDEIIAHLNNGGGLGAWNLIFRSGWKSLIEQLDVDGGQPKELIHFTALKEAAELDVRRAALSRRWERQVVPLGGPSPNDFGPLPEEIYQQYANRFRALLDWEAEVWNPAENSLRDAGFRWDEFFNEIPMEFKAHGDLFRRAQAVKTHLPSVLNARSVALRRMELETKLIEYRSAVVSGMPSNSQSDLLRDLVLAIESKDSGLHHKTCSRIIEIHGKMRAFLRRRELLDQLEKTAPAWAEAIRMRKSPHEAGAPPGDPGKAWLWRKLNDELEDRSRVSISELQEKIDRLVSELNNLTTQLIETSSWAHQTRRTGLKQRQSLNGWLQTMSKIGKGTGKRVPQLLVEARKQMGNCRSAVPVWIMPLSRVVDNYRPQKGLFDVVIIDEASQCDVMGLVALYLGKKVIVVGDHEQVSPEAVGRNVEDSQKLIDEYLQGIPNSHLYDGKLSIYDLAMQSFSGTICLREHFRCVPEIIQFSNDLSYDGKIKPLRDDSHSPLSPPVIAHRVAYASSNSKINNEEARVVAALIAAAVKQPEYAGQTFGVISLVGNDQAEEIEKILRSQLPPTEFAARKITCGNAAQFQGDERDVMFLSVVDGPTGNGPLRMRQEDLFKKRFNVAASRARNQLWVVHSLQPEIDLKPGDLRRRLIEYAQDPQSYLREIDRQLERTESEFERQVMKSLLDKGFVVTPQWKVGAYRIDMVVSGNRARLAVECDGDRWHPPEKIPEDMERQAILERLGWKFVRIRGSEYFRNPEAAMERVFAKLSDFGIEPAGFESPMNHNRNSGLEDLLRRAEQLRIEWFGSDDEFSSIGIKMDDPIDISSMPIALEFSDENSILDLD